MIKILETEDIEAVLQQLTSEGKVALLVDEQTMELCYPKVGREDIDLLCVPQGDECKDIEVAQHLWSTLQDLQYDRHDCLVTLGGGAICDLGAFIASTYMRGMRLVHIPTTLLAMIDAAIGGKTAINFGGKKNQIGTFYEAEEQLICLDFLETLPPEEMRSGWGELLKYGLLQGPPLLSEITDNEVLPVEVISKCIEYKLNIVAEDPYDHGVRRYLNLGHTAGHAFEAMSFGEEKRLLHGEGVAAGIVIALYMSYKRLDLEEKTLTSVARYIKGIFPKVSLSCRKYDQLWQLAKGDKKISGKDGLTMVLLTAVGEPTVVEGISREEWDEALDFYQDFM
ncbi:3-dehydroquinate synthase family protein [Porphyromonadaceae bacterium W3.11]|nr:3-dehydroquinate synthase family protein [Porphyromonadaceae bacterium W3.11]